MNEAANLALLRKCMDEHGMQKQHPHMERRVLPGYPFQIDSGYQLDEIRLRAYRAGAAVAHFDVIRGAKMQEAMKWIEDQIYAATRKVEST